jgi:hypothetical protein
LKEAFGYDMLEETSRKEGNGRTLAENLLTRKRRVLATQGNMCPYFFPVCVLHQMPQFTKKSCVIERCAHNHQMQCKWDENQKSTDPDIPPGNMSESSHLAWIDGHNKEGESCTNDHKVPLRYKQADGLLDSEGNLAERGAVGPTVIGWRVGDKPVDGKPRGIGIEGCYIATLEDERCAKDYFSYDPKAPGGGQCTCRGAEDKQKKHPVEIIQASGELRSGSPLWFHIEESGLAIAMNEAWSRYRNSDGQWRLNTAADTHDDIHEWYEMGDQDPGKGEMQKYQHRDKRLVLDGLR